jgi:hypothetical protein
MGRERRRDSHASETPIPNQTAGTLAVAHAMNEADRQKQDDESRLTKAIQTLSEHFDTVQLFVTRHEPGALDGTVSACRGTGNWYARIGYVKEWIIQHDGEAHNSSIKQ